MRTHARKPITYDATRTHAKQANRRSRYPLKIVHTPTSPYLAVLSVTWKSWPIMDVIEDPSRAEN